MRVGPSILCVTCDAFWKLGCRSGDLYDSLTVWSYRPPLLSRQQLIFSLFCTDLNIGEGVYGQLTWLTGTLGRRPIDVLLLGQPMLSHVYVREKRTPLTMCNRNVRSERIWIKFHHCRDIKRHSRAWRTFSWENGEKFLNFWKMAPSGVLYILERRWGPQASRGPG